MAQTIPHSSFPLDQHRKLLYEATDAENYVHKLFRLYADADPRTTDHVDIDVQIKYPDVPAPENEAESEAKRARLDIAERYPTSDAYIRLLRHSKVERFSRLRDGRLVFANLEDSALDTFKKLVDNQLLSCPVVNEHGFVGFVDVLDYVQYFTADYGKELRSEGYDFWQVLERHSVFEEMKVGDIIRKPTTRTGAHHALSTGYSLYTAFEMLAREPNIQRIAVVDEQRKNVVNVVSQSGLVEFVMDSMRLLGPKRSKPLRDCKSLFREIDRMYTDDIAIEGFTHMRRNHQYGVAVVDRKSGQLMGHLSPRDLKGIDTKSDWFQRLFEPVGTFLAQVMEMYPAHERPSDTIYVLPTDTLEIAVKKISVYKVHRVYIVDGHETRIPVGLITLKDILSEILA